MTEATNDIWYELLTSEAHSCYTEFPNFKMRVWINRGLSRYKIETIQYDSPEGITITESFWKANFFRVFFNPNRFNHTKKIYLVEPTFSWFPVKGTILRSTKTVVPHATQQIRQRELTGNPLQIHRSSRKKTVKEFYTDNR